MLNSSERINFIVDYLVSYKNKIEALNRQGLFDAAKLFELFAVEVSNFWFGKKFKNLNTDVSNYPYVDLVSEDRQTYVQVSTDKNIPKKIKSTLKKIETNRFSSLQDVKEVYFFVLGNSSAEKVHDCKVGNIDFIVKKHLITIDSILSMAKNNLDFQLNLYDLLIKEESISGCATKFKWVVENSKAVLNQNIIDLLNGEYEIDRSALIKRIKTENRQFVSVQGDAGSGKSALCKKILQKEELVLYARAEKLLEVNNLDDIWGFDINNVLQYLNHKRIIIFIDALEFIADGRQSKLEFLQQLYEVAKKHRNVYIFTSCRTFDKNAFVKIETNYNITVYRLAELTDEEIEAVALRYPIIRRMWSTKAYTPLLRNPFYLELIITKITSPDDIHDINELRTYIWNNLICLKNVSLSANISKQNIIETVKAIVFQRSKEFLTGVSEEMLDYEMVKLLLSHGIITETDGKVRLKYDIFEDICFEKYIDEQFDACKGNFINFFAAIEGLGRCIYRRFQIWVENKLFAKTNQEKFLYSLIFADTLPLGWKQQLIIGIVKSRFCDNFFEKYGSQIVERGLIADFLQVVNTYSFEVVSFKLSGNNTYPLLKPVGKGRECLIKLLKAHELYKISNLQKLVVKVCNDYSECWKTGGAEADTAVATCEMMEFCVKEEVLRRKRERELPLYFQVGIFLKPVYAFARFAAEWIRDFWRCVASDYKSNDRTAYEIATEIIRYTLQNTTVSLAQKLPVELCELARLYWLYEKKSKQDEHYLFDHSKSREPDKQYGFSKHADSYRFEFRKPENNMFMYTLAFGNFDIALEWAIELTNFAAEAYKKNRPQDITDITIAVDETGRQKIFIGTAGFWLAGRKDYTVHNLLGDCLYILKNAIFTFLDTNPWHLSQEEIKLLVEKWKRKIFKEANNIMMLTLIEEIGQRYYRLLPGYAIELASSIDIILYDLERVLSLGVNPLLAPLEKNIFKTMSIPNLPERYYSESKNIITLQQYMLDLQINGSVEYKDKAEKILNYLYTITPNDKENALRYLQIRNMDTRFAQKTLQKIEGQDAFLLTIKPEISGEAKKFVENHEKNDVTNDFFKKIYEIKKSFEDRKKEGKYGKTDCFKDIAQIRELISDSGFSCFAEKILIVLIANALLTEDLDRKERSELCNIWIEGINRILNGGILSFEEITTVVLFKQIEKELEDYTAMSLKKLMLELLLYRRENGIVNSVARQLKTYLCHNQKMAKLLFNTIIALAKDQMDHNLFNAAYMMRLNSENVYLPNRQTPFYNVDGAIFINGEQGFCSNREVIIEKYLLHEKNLEMKDFDIEQYDIGTLCYVSNCGLNLDNLPFRKVMKAIVAETITILNSGKECYGFYDIEQRGEVELFLRQEALTARAYIVADLLFDDIKFFKFRQPAYDFYYSVMNLFLPSFFDGYQNETIRKICIKNLKIFEKKLLLIEDEAIKKRLSKIMFLSLGFSGDWSQLQTRYSYADKCALNEFWSKYGKYHLKDLLKVVYQLHIPELLPEALLSINACFECNRLNRNLLSEVIDKQGDIIKMIITKVYLDFSDQVKADEELTQAYENFLEILIEFNMEEAAVLLDEFRVH